MKFAAFCAVFLYFLVFLVSPAHAEADIKAPSPEAHSAILMDFETGRVLWEKNPHEPLAMASTTKIMTAIIALEKGVLTDTVTVSRRAAAAPRVKMNLSAGEKIGLDSLLYALMLESANDAAIAIAEHIAGTVEDFCAMMTEKAKQIGAMNTVYETPNGLDEGDHHSTAYDLALITRYALRNDKFLELINTREKSFKSDSRSYYMYNKNRLLSEFNGANGVKTGYTGKAGHCFVGSAKRDGLWLISVVLGSGWGDRGREQKWVDTKGIMGFGFKNYVVTTLIEDNAGAGEVSVERSKTPEIGAVFADGLKIPVSAEEKASVEIKTNLPVSVKAPVSEGDKLGTAEVYISGEKYIEIELLANASALRHDLKTSMEKVLGGLLELVTLRDVRVTLPEF